MALLKILWTPLALQDLLDIRDYIQRGKPPSAQKEAEKIRRTVERLSRFPESGKKLQVIPQVREIIVSPYRIFYRIIRSQVEILRVYHGKRKILFENSVRK